MKKREAPMRYRFTDLEARVKAAPNDWALERCDPPREDERYMLFSNTPGCIGTTYYYGKLSELIYPIEQIEAGKQANGEEINPAA